MIILFHLFSRAMFTTDSFRDVTFDLLSGIANDPTKFDDYTHAYLTKLHERQDQDLLMKYTREIYEKILRNSICDCSNVINRC